MALIKCIECGKSISDKAVSCPNCGLPRSIETPNGLQRSASYYKPTATTEGNERQDFEFAQQFMEPPADASESPPPPLVEKNKLWAGGVRAIFGLACFWLIINVYWLATTDSDGWDLSIVIPHLIGVVVIIGVAALFIDKDMNQTKIPDNNPPQPTENAGPIFKSSNAFPWDRMMTPGTKSSGAYFLVVGLISLFFAAIKASTFLLFIGAIALIFGLIWLSSGTE